MLKNAYLLAKIGADTAENERISAENLPKIGNYPTGPRLRSRTAENPARSRPRRPPAGGRRTRARSVPAYLRGLTWSPVSTRAYMILQEDAGAELT